jgi:hypothetical protein
LRTAEKLSVIASKCSGNPVEKRQIRGWNRRNGVSINSLVTAMIAEAIGSRRRVRPS